MKTRVFQKYKWRNEEQEENIILPSGKFKDPKLQKLWHAAQNSHFSKAAMKSKVLCVSFVHDSTLAMTYQIMELGILVVYADWSLELTL